MTAKEAFVRTKEEKPMILLVIRRSGLLSFLQGIDLIRHY
jgi:hypothetical protein